MKVSVHSNIGKRRTTNQDYADYFVNAHQQLIAILCDGVGGHQAGDVASELTTRLIGERFMQLQEPLTHDNVQTWITETLQDTNTQVYQQSLSEAHLSGMATTVVLAIVLSDQVYIAHVGDSRAYNFYDNHLSQVTNDHSLVSELVRSGQITIEEGLKHPHRHVITQTIGGTASVEAEQVVLSTNEIGTLMLCSDGLTDMVKDQELGNFMQEKLELFELGERLVFAANEAGGVDNISIILMRQSQGEQEVDTWK